MANTFAWPKFLVNNYYLQILIWNEYIFDKSWEKKQVRTIYNLFPLRVTHKLADIFFSTYTVMNNFFTRNFEGYIFHIVFLIFWLRFTCLWLAVVAVRTMKTLQTNIYFCLTMLQLIMLFGCLIITPVYSI